MRKEKQQEKSEEFIKKEGSFISKVYFKVVLPLGIIGFVFALFYVLTPTTIWVPDIIRKWFSLSFLVMGYEVARYINKVFFGGDWSAWDPHKF